MKELTNPVSAYRITLMNQFDSEIFGWLELRHGGKPSGFIYITTKPITEAPHLSHDGSYIVMTMPASLLNELLTILRTERNLVIRFFDPESSGVAPSAFLQTEPIGGPDQNAEHPNLNLLDPQLTPLFKNAMT